MIKKIKFNWRVIIQWMNLFNPVMPSGKILNVPMDILNMVSNFVQQFGQEFTIVESIVK